MDELLEQFVIEGRDLITQAEAALDGLVAAPGDMLAIDSLFRALHTLKGSVQIFDLAPAERLLHAAEDRLTRARASGEGVDPALLAALTACIDQTDRWIDEMERTGALGEKAAHVSEGLLAGFGGGALSAADGTSGGDEPAWLDRLKQAAADRIAHADAALTGFRYVPDKDAFFRGDDPMAIMASVPGLEYLSVEADGAWPSLPDWEPFRCYARIEGVSSAPAKDIRAAFKLVPDQVQFAAIAVEEAAVGEEVAHISAARTMRVDAGRIERLASEVGELVVAANGLAHIARLAGRIDPELAAGLKTVQADIERISGGLERAVAAIRLVPLAPTLRKLPRLVREIADAAGKTIDFEIRGEGLEVDKHIADGLFEPLLHIIRNAIDHGIEDAATRRDVQKDAAGRLLLTVSRRGDEAVIAIQDDGKGIDPDRIRDAAVERGLITRSAADAMSDSQAIRLILTTGFSTARTVTTLSGRGVGMDAVKAAIDRLRGRIAIESRPAIGTTFELRLPLDAITTRLLIVRAGEERYGIRLDQIVETARIATGDIHMVGKGQACILRDRTMPVIDLSTMIGGPACAGATARLLVTERAGEPVAIRVDGFERRIDAIVRENDGLLRGLPGMAGAALTNDGGVLLVLDLPELIA